MFVGRKKELEYLEDIYSKSGNSILILYGHKGVGKTALMFRFMQEKPFDYYLARACSETEQCHLWCQENDFPIKGESASFSDIFHLLEFKHKDKPGKKVLFIDEFQNIIRYSDHFMEELLEFVNHSGNLSSKDSLMNTTGDLDRGPGNEYMIVLGSSSISFVENSFVPKVGARALQIQGFFKVPPLKFLDCKEYFFGYSTEECIKTYGLLGGYPAYWNQFSHQLSVEENIEHMILHDSRFLREEGERVVSADLREINVYGTILYCLSEGINKLNDLHNHTGYSRAKISVYLKNLMERELVEKVFAFEGASSINAKKGIYRISGSYLNFYYRFLFRNASILQVNGPRKYYAEYVKKELPCFYEEQLRILCKEYMDECNSQNKLPIYGILSGEWVGKEGTIDYILQDENGDNILCFCDWQKDELTRSDLVQYYQIIESARLSPDYIYVFYRGNLTEELAIEVEKKENVHFLSLESLY